MSNLHTTSLKLLDLPSYSCSFDFFGNTLRVEFTWVERVGKRFMTVTDSYGEVLLQNTALVVGESYPFNNKAKLLGLPCQAYLDFKVGTDMSEDYINWSRNMFLVFSVITEE